jgi:hypothetical protein
MANNKPNAVLRPRPTRTQKRRQNAAGVGRQGWYGGAAQKEWQDDGAKKARKASLAAQHDTQQH